MKKNANRGVIFERWAKTWQLPQRIDGAQSLSVQALVKQRNAVHIKNSEQTKKEVLR